MLWVLSGNMSSGQASWGSRKWNQQSFFSFSSSFFPPAFLYSTMNPLISNVQLLLVSCQRWCNCKPFLQFIPVPQTSHWALIIMSNFPLRKILLSPYVPWSVRLDVIRVYCTDPLWEKRLRAVDPLIHPRIWPITSSSSSSSSSTLGQSRPGLEWIVGPYWVGYISGFF